MFQLADINQTSNTSFSTKDNLPKSSPSSTPSSSASSSKSGSKIDISSYDDFGVNSQNGFLPSEPPLERLQGQVSEIAKKWESLLDQAQQIPLMLAGGGPDFEESKKIEGRRWRREIREVSSDFRFQARPLKWVTTFEKSLADLS